MLFNSLQYLIFFPAVIFAYFALPHRWRWVLLLAASYYFYMCWQPEYVLIIIFSTFLDYGAAIQMDKAKRPTARKAWLALSVVTNLTVLFSFKYFNFFSDSVTATLEQFNIMYNAPMFDILLPVGISFYTFQTLSYTIDVYRGERAAERHLGIFALYVSFFPQLVAGPIERSTTLMPQLHQRHAFNYDRAVSGLKQMAWGFMKKLVVADRLAIYVDTIYNNHSHHSGASLVVATFFFAFQIYCDFSGYSDIAIGSARIMGYDLMENFRRPYFASNIKEFWGRWHISLSTWFRDYVYIPLGGNRTVKWRWYYNLVITFLVSGVWHGANWTYMIWGGLHGFYLVFAMVSATWRDRFIAVLGLHKIPKLHTALNIGLTFALVCIAWVFFRANSATAATDILLKMATFEGTVYFGGQQNFAYSVLAVLLLLAVEVRQEWFTWQVPGWNRAIVQQVSYAIVIAVILLLGVFDAGQFIYFQF